MNSKPGITLSINPWYYCNFKCDFCYLTKNQLNDKTILSLDKLQSMLKEVSRYYLIEHIDLYGGEVFLLPSTYLLELKTILLNYVEEINVNTNLSVVNDIVNDPDFYISVSYDFKAREKSEIVAVNMCKLEKEFSVLMLASPELIKKKPEDIITFFNRYNKLRTVEVKPYSTNQANSLPVKYTEYEEFVKGLILSPIKKNFEFTNDHLLNQVLSNNRNAFSDDHVYITPKGEFAVLEFDLNQREYFYPLSNVEDYIDWTFKEKNRVLSNNFCSKCKYSGRCLSEHLKEVKDLDNSCNGFYNLIEWKRGLIK